MARPKKDIAFDLVNKLLENEIPESLVAKVSDIEIEPPSLPEKPTGQCGCSSCSNKNGPLTFAQIREALKNTNYLGCGIELTAHLWWENFTRPRLMEYFAQNNIAEIKPVPVMVKEKVEKTGGCTKHPNYSGIRLGANARACSSCLALYKQIHSNGFKEIRNG